MNNNYAIHVALSISNIHLNTNQAKQLNNQQNPDCGVINIS